MSVRIVPVSKQPDLAALAAEWRVRAFFDQPGGYTVEEMAALILAPPVGPKETFVLFDGDRAVGTAWLMRSDLSSRPDLTPWLGGLFVEPPFRASGHATALVRQVEDFARAPWCPSSGSTPCTLKDSTCGLAGSTPGWNRDASC